MDIGSSKIIYSGILEGSERAMQGVGIFLDDQMKKAWNRAGSVVECRGGRLLRIQVEIERRTFHVIACYAPTFRATDLEKEEFYRDLAEMVGRCKANEELVVLGDFNARVGVREAPAESDENESTDLALGPFGMTELNDNGRLLLDFFRNGRRKPLRVMSTCYHHKEDGTWMHNLTKRWHQIDHILPSNRTAQLFTDVKTLTGIDWDSDRRMVTMKIRVMPKSEQPWGRHTRLVPETRLPLCHASTTTSPRLA